MGENNKTFQENANLDLGRMGLYRTTSNMEIAGYEATRDIENTERLDKGFK